MKKGCLPAWTLSKPVMAGQDLVTVLPIVKNVLCASTARAAVTCVLPLIQITQVRHVGLHFVSRHNFESGCFV